jgi:hypothetical protein
MGTYTLYAPVRKHMEPMLSSAFRYRLDDMARDSTVASHDFVIGVDRRRHVCFILYSAAVAGGVVCLEVGWVKVGFGEGVSHFCMRMSWECGDENVWKAVYIDR